MEKIGDKSGKEANSASPCVLRIIGMVRSSLVRLEDCPKMGSEGAPEALLEIDPAFAEGLDGISPGAEIVVLTWFHKADRGVLKVHPRGDRERPIRGVFSTRSPDRPNPVGLHRVTVIEVEKPARIRVYPLEALDGTPVIDIKPAFDKSSDA